MNLLALIGIVGGAVGLVSGVLVLRRGLAEKKHWTKPPAVAVASPSAPPSPPNLAEVSSDVEKWMETNE